jgi:hypothetical protein
MQRRAAAFLPGGTLARMLSNRKVFARVADTIVVHGGLLPLHAETGLEVINKLTRDYLLGSMSKEQVDDFLPFMFAEESPVWTRRYSGHQLPGLAENMAKPQDQPTNLPKIKLSFAL